VRGCAPGTLWLRATSPGYVEALVSHEIHEAPLAPIEIRITTGEEIRGYCLRGDAPVHEFRVGFWHGSPDGQNIVEFDNREDGSFVVDQAPVGEVFVYAYGDDLPPSKVEHVRVERGSGADVVLRIPATVHGHGKVVDLGTGAPIPSASVQLFIAYADRLVTARGAARPAEPDGTFELDDLAVGLNAFTVSAPGYGEAVGDVVAREGEPADMGVFALAPSKPLTVRILTGPELDPSRCTIEFRREPKRTFDESGETVYDGVAAGTVGFRITTPDEWALDLSRTLRLGDEWLIEVPIGSGGEAVEVEIVTEAGEPLPERATLMAVTRLEGVLRKQYYGIPESRVVEVTGPFGEDLTLEVWGQDVHRPFAVDNVRIADLGERHVRIQLRRSEWTLRVVDERDDPLPETYVMLTIPESVSGWRKHGTTDARGELRFSGFGHETISAGLVHPLKGSRPFVPIDLRGDPDEVIVVKLDARARLCVQLLDGDYPLEGVELEIVSAGAIKYLSMKGTDEQGYSVYEPLAEGDYAIRVDHPGLWPARETVRAAPDAAPIVVQARRLGGARISVVNSEGMPAAGAVVELVSVELGESVSSWTERGLVAEPATGMTTSASGVLEIGGLPNGPYTWRAALPGGAVREGRVTVPPRDQARIDVRLP
jgi:hypothetical protein